MLLFLPEALDNVSGDLLACMLVTWFTKSLHLGGKAFIGDTSSLASLSLQEKLGIHRGPMSDYAHRSAYCRNWKKLYPKQSLRNT